MDEFIEGLQDANTIFFGFEESESAGSTYKVYLEYWDKLRDKIPADAACREPHLLHKGFKWHIDAPEKHLVTRYQCLPGL